MLVQNRGLLMAALSLAILLSVLPPARAQINDNQGGANTSSGTSERMIKLQLDDADLETSLKLLFEQAGVQYTVDPTLVINSYITIRITQPFPEALDTLLRASNQNLTYQVENGVYRIVKEEFPGAPPQTTPDRIAPGDDTAQPPVNPATPPEAAKLTPPTQPSYLPWAALGLVVLVGSGVAWRARVQRAGNTAPTTGRTATPAAPVVSAVGELPAKAPAVNQTAAAANLAQSQVSRQQSATLLEQNNTPDGERKGLTPTPFSQAANRINAKNAPDGERSDGVQEPQRQAPDISPAATPIAGAAADFVSEQLRAILTRYGLDVCKEPARFRALLWDLCPDHRRECHLLLMALEEQIPTELRSSAIPEQLLLPRLIQRMREHRAVEEASARWAVETWQAALKGASSAT
jgi:hypothetical protein